MSTRSGPTWSSSIRCRRCTTPSSSPLPARSSRCASAPTSWWARPRQRGMATVLVGHVTKEGAIAGPRLLEHIVDTVLSFEGERHHALRLLRALKHRFGSTAELGVFEMTDHGLAGVPDAGRLFLGDRRPGVAGSAVVPTVEGRRPLLVEIQALVAPSPAYQPRRSAQGVDAGRLAVILAVLERRLGLGIGSAEVFAPRRRRRSGGRARRRPGARPGRGLVARLASPSPKGWSPAPRSASAASCARSRQLQPRLAEAARLGFRHALVPESAPAPPPRLELLRARHPRGGLGSRRPRPNRQVSARRASSRKEADTIARPSPTNLNGACRLA